MSRFANCFTMHMNVYVNVVLVKQKASVNVSEMVYHTPIKSNWNEVYIYIYKYTYIYIYTQVQVFKTSPALVLCCNKQSSEESEILTVNVPLTVTDEVVQVHNLTLYKLVIHNCYFAQVSRKRYSTTDNADVTT